MHLKSIRLEGFKSFPGRNVLEFGPGVSVVVGPNGSGKSNITDAVVWALGEQSPTTVRAGQMQDVIFAGGRGSTQSNSAEVEVIIDIEGSEVDLDLSEISILRRIDRWGAREYRLNGATCRLTDVVELLGDAGLGREMHSVVSQGRVEKIVHSKPADRRVLLEEAAGLGKFRRRRRRAQLKLERTQQNVDRLLDLEREARSRLRPLKRKAEAADLHRRLERQSNEALFELRADDLRTAKLELAECEAAVSAVRKQQGVVEAQLAEVAAQRKATEQQLAERAAGGEQLSRRVLTLRGALDRMKMRREQTQRTLIQLQTTVNQATDSLAALEQQGDDPSVAERESLKSKLAEAEAELKRLDLERERRLETELEQLGVKLAKAEELHAAAEQKFFSERDALAAAQAKAADVRERQEVAERELDAAKRDVNRISGELEALDHYLRSAAATPEGAQALIDGLEVASGFEDAVASVLGPRLRAAVVGDLVRGQELLDGSGESGGAALIASSVQPRSSGAAPHMDAVALADQVSGEGQASKLGQLLLADCWLVPDLALLPANFSGVAVTRAGRVWDARLHELRQAPAGGERRLLQERARRDEMRNELESARERQEATTRKLNEAVEAVAEVQAAVTRHRDRAAASEQERDTAADAVRRLKHQRELRANSDDDAFDEERRARVLAEQERAQERIAGLDAEAQRELDQRNAASTSQQLGQLLITAGTAALEAFEVGCAALGKQVEFAEQQLATERASGEAIAAELRKHASSEAELQQTLHAHSEQVTAAEVAAQAVRTRESDALRELTEVAQTLEREVQEPQAALAAERRTELETQRERLKRRREQLGPVNPLAREEYEDAREELEELEGQRTDLEDAMRELRKIIAEADKQIRDSFHATFEQTAANFSSLIEELFPGGNGKLALVELEQPRPEKFAASPEADAQAEATGDDAEATESEDAPEADEGAPFGDSPHERLGVELQVAPAGKSPRSLSLLSGGEKSLTALAFLFAVFLARPCPFYILDEVEAALDDVNLDRFISLLRKHRNDAQFIVVTHQKRTMEAADYLYGVSMAGDGVSKVVSRKLPQETEKTGLHESLGVA